MKVVCMVLFFTEFPDDALTFPIVRTDIDGLGDCTVVLGLLWEYFWKEVNSNFDLFNG